MMSHATTSNSATLHAHRQNGKLYLKNGKLYLRTSPSKPAGAADETGAEHASGTASNANYGYLMLRERHQVFEQIAAEQDLERQIQYFSLYALLFSAIYGFLTGMYSGNLQTIAGAVKFPLLLFGTLFLCLPPLYMVNLLIGVTLSFRQTLALLLGATYAMTAFLASLSPVLVFAMLNTTSSPIIGLIALVSCGLSGMFAIHCVWQGMEYLTARHGGPSHGWIVKLWSLMYILVGTQLSWGLRPFIGERGTFALFRPVGGNFFSAVFRLVEEILINFL